MGILVSSLANYILPSVMSLTGTVVQGVGTMHGSLTSFVAKVGYHGLIATLSLLG